MPFGAAKLRRELIEVHNTIAVRVLSIMWYIQDVVYILYSCFSLMVYIAYIVPYSIIYIYIDHTVNDLRASELEPEAPSHSKSAASVPSGGPWQQHLVEFLANTSIYILSYIKCLYICYHIYKCICTLSYIFIYTVIYVYYMGFNATDKDYDSINQQSEPTIHSHLLYHDTYAYIYIHIITYMIHIYAYTYIYVFLIHKYIYNMYICIHTYT